MAENEHRPRARRLGGEHDVRPADRVLLPHDRTVRRRVHAGGPMLDVRQGGRVATLGRVDLLVGHDRVGGRGAVHRAPAHLPWYVYINKTPPSVPAHPVRMTGFFFLGGAGCTALLLLVESH